MDKKFFKHNEANQIASHIFQSIAPAYTGNGLKDMLHQGNWPHDAEYGVLFIFKKLDGIQVLKKEETIFFYSSAAMQMGIEQKKNSLQPGELLEIHMYKWDLGPEYMGVIS